MIHGLAITHAGTVVGTDGRDFREPRVERCPARRLNANALFDNDGRASLSLTEDVHEMSVDVDEFAQGKRREPHLSGRPDHRVEQPLERRRHVVATPRVDGRRLDDGATRRNQPIEASRLVSLPIGPASCRPRK